MGWGTGGGQYGSSNKRLKCIGGEHAGVGVGTKGGDGILKTLDRHTHHISLSLIKTPTHGMLLSACASATSNL